MSEQIERRQFGPYRFVRALEPSDLAMRWLALHVRAQTSHMLHEFELASDRSERRRLLNALDALSTLSHPHFLQIERYALNHSGRVCVVTPYPGHQDGLLTLDRLLEAKGGRMSPYEAERAVLQILDAAAFAHHLGYCHGPVRPEEVLVDRHGSVAIEHYGLRRRLAGLDGANQELIRDEVRSVVEIAYCLVTGLFPDEPHIRAARLVKRLPRAWDEWFEVGLDASGGFDSADAAVSQLPSRLGEDRDSMPEPEVRAGFWKIRRAVRSGS